MSTGRPRLVRVVAVLVAGVLAFGVPFAFAFRGLGIISAVVLGLVVAGGLLLVIDRTAAPQTDRSRRRFLGAAGVAGLAMAAGGASLGGVVERLSRPEPRTLLWDMARRVGAEGMRYIKRGHFPGRSGELQLVLAPYNTANYPWESRGLAPRDPRSSHALVWNYAQRIPVAVYAPGLVETPESFSDAVTLADLAPSMGQLMGFDFPGRDGSPLPGLPAAPKPPKVIVTFVIDGGGWNVLTEWPDAWPHLRALFGRSLLYRNAVVGSFPAVTACAHATIGTGAFPSGHGISGHNVWHEGEVRAVYGPRGEVDPSFLLLPTLAEAWNEETGDRAWVGEIGYQTWHLGMLGRGGRRPVGRLPVAVYFQGAGEWRPQNPDLYRLPEGAPPREQLDAYVKEFVLAAGGERTQAARGRVCCAPPIVRHQGDLVEAMFAREPIGEGPVTSLLYINYKAPDYAGHVFNMQHPRQGVVLRAVDQELERLRRMLEARFKPGEFVLIVTADHGQCPLANDSGGVRLDPIELVLDLERFVGAEQGSMVERIRPSEVFLSSQGVRRAGVNAAEMAAFLGDYRYRRNIGPYIRPEAIQSDRLDRPQFAGVFPGAFIDRLQDSEVARLGQGDYPEADPGIPSP
jgi:hypothetical protein